MMRDELANLIQEVKRRHGWSDYSIENRFGSPRLVHTVLHGKRGPWPETGERFKEWLLQQLEHEPTQ